MTDALTCEKLILIEDVPDEQGKPVSYHRRCGQPASECEIGGLLTKAKAILCGSHRALAERQSYLSENGFPKGKISKKAKESGYVQTRLPGTGVLG